MNQIIYTETVHCTKMVQKTLTAPKDWACFTSATNSSLHKKAETVMSKVTQPNATPSQIEGALVAFVRGWNRMCENPRHREAGVGDTAVRECVLGFVADVLKAKGINWMDYRVIRQLADRKEWKLRGVA